jgi:hypothetical protein
MPPQLTKKNEQDLREWSNFGKHYLRKLIIMSAISNIEAQHHLIVHIENALGECGLTKSNDDTFWLDDRFYLRCLKVHPKVIIYDSHADDDAVVLFVINQDEFVGLFERIRFFWSSIRSKKS